MNAEIFVIPWPQYSDDGTITWELRVEAPKFRGTLCWSTRLGRFRKDNHIWRLRRGSPSVYRAAVDLITDFCAKLQRQRDMGRDTKPLSCDIHSNLSDSYKRDALCARGGYALSHGCHSDRSSCDSDILRDRTVSDGITCGDPSAETLCARAHLREAS